LVLNKKAQAEDFLSDLIPAIILIIIGLIMMAYINNYSADDFLHRGEIIGFAEERFQVVPFLVFLKMPLDKGQRVVDLFYNLDKNQQYLVDGIYGYRYHCSPSLLIKFDRLNFKRYYGWYISVTKGKEKLFECSSSFAYEDGSWEPLKKHIDDKIPMLKRDKFVLPVKGSKDKIYVEVGYTK
jgi:hypothetical protein